jgi:hypothetical protein
MFGAVADVVVVVVVMSGSPSMVGGMALLVA